MTGGATVNQQRAAYRYLSLIDAATNLSGMSAAYSHCSSKYNLSITAALQLPAEQGGLQGALQVALRAVLPAALQAALPAALPAALQGALTELYVMGAQVSTSFLR